MEITQGIEHVGYGVLYGYGTTEIKIHKPWRQFVVVSIYRVSFKDYAIFMENNHFPLQNADKWFVDLKSLLHDTLGNSKGADFFATVRKRTDVFLQPRLISGINFDKLRELVEMGMDNFDFEWFPNSVEVESTEEVDQLYTDAVNKLTRLLVDSDITRSDIPSMDADSLRRLCSLIAMPPSDFVAPIPADLDIEL